MDRVSFEKESIETYVDNASSTDTTRRRSVGEEQAELPSEITWASVSQIVASFFLTFNTWGIVNSFGVYQSYYTAVSDIDRTDSQISWIGSLQAFIILAALIVTGPLFDRGHARNLTAGGLVLVVLGMMMTSLCTQYWQLMLAQGLCVGLGHGCLFIVAIGQISLTFKRRRWMAMGLAQSGGSIGAIVYSVVFRSVQPAAGAAWATRATAFIMLGTLSISVLLLRPHKLPKPRQVFDARAFRNGPFDMFAVASFAGFMGLYIPFFYIQQYAYTHGVTTIDLAFYMLAILNAGSVIGRIVPGFVADEFGLLNTYTGCTVRASIFAFGWIACHNFGSIVAFSLLYGFFSGCAAALQPAVLASLCPEPNLVGTWVGMGSLFSATGLLLGNPIGGLTFKGHDWLGLQLFCGCLVIACAAATLATRTLRAGTNTTAKV